MITTIQIYISDKVVNFLSRNVLSNSTTPTGSKMGIV